MGTCCSSQSDQIQNEDNKYKNFFNNSTLDNTSTLTLDGNTLYGKVVDIYDGDTCTIILPFKDKPYKFNVRLAEIDTCEMKSKSPLNKELALKARNRLLELITEQKSQLEDRKNIRQLLNSNNFILSVKCGKYDKYGRLLCWLYKKDKLETVSFNQILVNEKLAYNYNGKKKLTEQEQLNLLN